VLDGQHPTLAGLDGAHALATYVFASHGHETLAEVRTGGTCRVQHGVHPQQVDAGRLFAEARARLLAD
jgi:formimidoylglutamate deiminase